MKATGIVRRVSDAHQVVVPKEFQAGFGIGIGTEVLLYRRSDGLCITKSRPIKDLNLTAAYVATVDELRRVKIPRMLRDQLSIKSGETPLEIFTEPDTLVYKVYAPEPILLNLETTESERKILIDLIEAEIEDNETNDNNVNKAGYGKALTVLLKKVKELY